MTLTRRARRTLTLAVPTTAAVAALSGLAVAGVLGPHHDTSTSRPKVASSPTVSDTPTQRPSPSTTPSTSPSATASGPSAPVTASSAPPPADLDLHQVNWKEVALPGQTCFSNSPIQLQDGRAVLPATPYNHEVMLDLVWDPANITYGPVEGEGTNDAVLSVDCSNEHSNASGALLNSLVVFSGRGGTLHALGVLLPGVQPADELPTLMAQPTITSRQLSVGQAFYGPHDNTATPSGRATTVFTWTGSGFTSRTTIKQQPITAPATAPPTAPPHF